MNVLRTATKAPNPPPGVVPEGSEWIKRPSDGKWLLIELEADDDTIIILDEDAPSSQTDH
jgi:hypothetical protein